MRLASGALFVAAFLIACGDDVATMPDADDAGWGPDGGAGIAIAPPAPPADPLPPVLGPCPDGWRAVEDDGYGWCDPWPETGRAECAAGEAHFPGEPACRAIGVESAGEWPEGLPAGVTVLHVRAGEPIGGDGSAASPLPSITEAMARAGAGTILAVARGTYDERVSVRAGVTVWGASLTDTVLTRSGAPNTLSAVIAAGGRDAVVRNLTITGNANGADAVGAGRTLRLEDVLIESTESVGVYVGSGGTVEAEDLVVRDTRSLDGRLGRGISVENGGIARISHAVLERCSESALFVSLGGRLEASDTAIHDVRERASDRTRGYGVITLEEGDAQLARVAISETRAGALFAIGPNAVVAGDQLVIRDTLGQAFDGAAAALLVQPGSEVTLARTLIERTMNAGAYIDGDGAVVTLRDLVVRDTGALETPGASAGGRGLLIQYGAAVEIERAVVDRTVGVALAVYDADLQASDVLVRETSPSMVEPSFAHGIGLDTGGSLVVRRARIERSGILGIGANAGTVDVEDVVVRGMVDGIALQAQGDVSFTARRVLVEDGAGAGLNAIQGARFVAEDVVIRRTAASPATDLYGHALSATLGGSLEVTRVLVEEATQIGVAVAGGSATLTDAIVRDTRVRSDGMAGHGVHAQEGGTVRLERGLVAGSGGAGIYLISPGTTGTFTDIAVRDTRGSRLMDLDGVLGHGLSVLDGASANVTGGLFERNREVAIVAFLNSEIVLDDVEVLDTLERACAETGCATGGAGTGIAAFENARVRATRFSVRRSALAGVQVGRNGEMDLSEGEVTDNTVGANVQVPGFDVTRLTEGVVYRENGVNLDATELPVPSSSTVTSM